MTVGSLFSGIGGLDLGLERAGFEIRWQIEIDDFCLRVLEKHWPDVRRYRDIKAVRGDELEPVDLVAGGPPCQPVSLAGRKLGEADPRWLWPEFDRIVRRLRPRYVLVENVVGLLVRGMGRILGDLAAAGYDAEWCVLPAAVVGAPHLRERVWIVAYSGGSGLAWPRVFLEPPDRSTYWQAHQPPVCRVDDGIPARVVRHELTALGNAVVPQVAEVIGRAIIRAERRREHGVDH